MKTRYTRLMALAAALVMTVGGLSSCGASDASTVGGGNSYNRSDNTNKVQQDNISGGTNGKDSIRTEGNDVAADEVTGGDANYETEGGTATAGEAAMPTQKSDITAEEYAKLEENGWSFVKDEPLSTFSTDVDTASYANARRMLESGMRVEPYSVRAEEFVNYFTYDYPQPDGEHPISVTTQLSDCPWNDKAKLMLVGVQAKKIEQETRPPMNIVLLIDVSGSMASADKLPLAQTAFMMLAENLDENDRVSIVTYSGEERVVLAGAAGDDFAAISESINSLEAGGATAGEAGINMAYSLAEEYFIEGGNNRIVMATDGDLNVGISSAEELTALIEKKREGGVYLSVLGFGTGNLKDDRLEALADNGNGNYSYIDSEREAQKVLLSELNATLFTVAKDVKAQVEFNPANVAAYRLVGYENRMLEAEDFTDDKKDAGDMGAGHSATALYEIIPAKGVLGSDGTDGIELKYQPTETETESTQEAVLTDELLTVKLRYKLPDGDKSTELSKPVMVADYTEKAPAELAFAVCAAELALFLRGSEYSNVTPDMIRKQLTDELLTDEYRKEFVELLTDAEQIYQ